MLDVENENEKLFTSDYPTYPKSVVLRSNPNLPVREKFYSTTTDNETSSSDSSQESTSVDGKESTTTTDKDSYV